MPYRIDEARMSLWRQLFVDPPFSVKALPGYQAQTASNPFITFADLPVRSRYRFMLDEAQFTIMGFIKGPVCRGQQALDVIDDYFWVFFNDPSLVDNTEQSRFLAANSRNLQLPAELESNAPVLRHWLSFAEGERRYLAARAALVKAEGIRMLPQGARLIWDGDSEQGHPNPNAALTVFRHFDSASVEQGLIGDNPQTAWIIGYPLLERLHYVLVAGYDVYGISVTSSEAGCTWISCALRASRPFFRCSRTTRTPRSSTSGTAMHPGGRWTTSRPATCRWAIAPTSSWPAFRRTKLTESCSAGCAGAWDSWRSARPSS